MHRESRVEPRESLSEKAPRKVVGALREVAVPTVVEAEAYPPRVRPAAVEGFANEVSVAAVVRGLHRGGREGATVNARPAGGWRAFVCVRGGAGYGCGACVTMGFAWGVPARAAALLKKETNSH